MKKSGLPVTILLLVICINLITLAKNLKFLEGKYDPVLIGEKIVENLLQRDYMIYINRGLHYSEAGTAVGALRCARSTQRKDLIEKIIARYEPLLYDTSILVCRRPHVDLSVIGIVPLEIYLVTGNEDFLKQGLTFADYQWDTLETHGLTHEARFWIDDMYMVGMLQIQTYRATGKNIYAERAAKFLSVYIDSLQQTNGLFFHGGVSHYFWGRGNGWVASAMAEVLSSLPKENEYYYIILKGYRKMMSALLQYQTENGMWRQIIDYPYSWTESSCTAMFAYAMAVGIDKGLLPKKKYLKAVKKAWIALVNHLNKDGNLREVCVGTGQVNDLEFYLKRPRVCGDFHGQAPMLWLTSKMIEWKYRED